MNDVSTITFNEKGEAELMAIDISQEDTALLTKQLMEQMSTVGFCQIVNIPGHDEDKLLEAIKAFSAIPLEDKMKLALQHYRNENTNLFHGYFPFLERDVANKEFFQLSRPTSDLSEWEKNGCPLYQDAPWPQNSLDLGIDWVLETFREHWERMH